MLDFVAAGHAPTIQPPRLDCHLPSSTPATMSQTASTPAAYGLWDIAEIERDTDWV